MMADLTVVCWAAWKAAQMVARWVVMSGERMAEMSVDG